MTSPRPDTRLLVTSPITTDLSQRETDLTTTGAGAYEDASARTALDGTGNGRSFEVSVELDSSSDGVMICHGADGMGDPAYRIGITSGNVIFVRGGMEVAFVVPPNLDGSLKTYIIAWSTEPNPATTGSSDALRSEYLVYDVDGDEIAYGADTHSVISPDPALAFSIGGEWDGGTLNSAFSDTINAVAISARFHTRTETRERCVAQTAAPDPDGITAVEGPVIPAQACEAGALVGPQYQAAAASLAVGSNRHRLLGPVVQWDTPTPPTWIADFAETAELHRIYTLSDGYQTHLGWLWRRKIPRHAEYLRTVVQWATWPPLGGDVDASLRIYASNLPPHLAVEWQAQTLTRTTDDGVEGDGVLEVFADLLVVRDLDGYTWLWLGAVVGEDSAMMVRGGSITPISSATVNGQPPNQWGP